MRARFLSFVRALVAVVCFVTTPCLTDAATPRFLSIIVSDRLTSDGSLQFSLRAIGLSFPRGPIEELIAPNGSVIHTGLLDDFPTFDSFQEMNSLLFGQWEYRVAPSSDPTAFESYRFAISPFEPDDVTVDRPRILEPRGIFVDSNFQIIWDPPSDNYGIGSAGMLADFELVQPGVIAVESRHIPSRPNDGYVRFSTSKSQTLQSFVSAVEPPSPAATYDLTVRFSYSRVIEKTFYPGIVPEPMTASLAAMSLVCAMFARRLW